MKNKNHFLITSLITILLIGSACNNEKSKEEKIGSVKADSIVQEADKKNKDSSLYLKAEFINFQLGDVSHYLFKDEKMKEWDFADCEDSKMKFAIELSPDKANEQNQGFASNKDLKGKWFNLKYVYKMQPEYQDGPMAKVPVIIEATAIAK